MYNRTYKVKKRISKLANHKQILVLPGVNASTESIAARPKSGPNAEPFEEIDPELRWAIWDSDPGAKLWQAAELVHDFVPALNAATSNALRQGLLDTSPGPPPAAVPSTTSKPTIPPLANFNARTDCSSLEFETHLPAWRLGNFSANFISVIS